MSICFVVCYFGKLPIWFDAFMLSCEKNKSIDWLIFTDAETPESYPGNLKFQYLSLAQFNTIAQEVIEKDINVQMPYKLCDFKPLYGDLFKSHLKNYTYWGHCDVDLVWGYITRFLNDIKYQQYEIISTRRYSISGHFTLYKNKPEIYELYKEIKNYWKPLMDKKYRGFDEGYFSYYIYTLYKKNDGLNIYWPEDLGIHRYTLRRKPLGWFWKNGKIFDQSGQEHLYLHFMNWKKTIAQIDFTFQEKPTQFYIYKTGMSTQKEKVKFNLANYPLKTPWHALKYSVKTVFEKITKKTRSELDNYLLDYLKIEDRYPT